MDWVVDTGDTGSVSALRREITSYLRRHADESTDLADCELVISELITNVARHAAGPVWVSLDGPRSNRR
jgi:anti-sigma regulatory factor (Ser/Thr protein kinase)